jgi:hypothetical protein
MKRRVVLPALALATLVVLAGCVTVPTGPAVMVLPGQYKPFDQFRVDDIECRNFAAAAVGGSAQQASDSAAAFTLGATAVGAAVGAAIGATTGQAGAGAAIGAGSGLVVGAAGGSSQSYGSQYDIQARYDSAYMQCMYAKGNQIPVRSSSRVSYGSPPSYAPPPTQYSAPPPASSGSTAPYSAPPPPSRTY